VIEPRIQYVTTGDGVNIAYATAGEGSCLIVAPSPPVSHVQHQWNVFPELYGGLVRFRTICFDFPGSGLSDRRPIDFSMDAMLPKMEAVADRVASAPFALLAIMDGAPFAIAYTAAHPEAVSHLIIVDGYTKYSDLEPGPFAEVEATLREQDWTLYTETMAKVLMGFEDPVLTAAFGEFIRDCVEPEALRAAFSAQAKGAWDVAPELLGQIVAPTLVLHNRGNRFYAVNVGRRIAAAIPGARFMLVDDMTYKEVPPLIERFILETTAQKGRDVPSGMTAILFADIADSTALTERLGDATFRERARELDSALRFAIREQSGMPIEGRLLGDGVLAVFTSARHAIEAALACRAAGAGAGMPLHLGLHGGAVNIAARISGLSEPGEVLVSDTVRALARTSAGAAFEDRGQQRLKGVSDSVHVWAVKPGDASSLSEISSRRKSAYPDQLTAREVEVLRLIAGGRTNAEISLELALSKRTVARHITNIYGKIGARSKVDAASYAMRHGLTREAEN
jgi:class 3 adenylate cyclase/DNA-binding CsgD family transcriptional regulator